VFTIEAHDEIEQIASGTHDRLVIDSVTKFVEKTKAKGTSKQ
jgi:predicted thioesterase